MCNFCQFHKLEGMKGNLPQDDKLIPTDMETYNAKCLNITKKNMSNIFSYYFLFFKQIEINFSCNVRLKYLYDLKIISVSTLSCSKGLLWIIEEDKTRYLLLYLSVDEKRFRRPHNKSLVQLSLGTYKLNLLMTNFDPCLQWW